MKKLLLLIPLTFLSVPVQAQQVTVYQSCVGEVYFPGYYDQYGNFVQGGVSTTRVPCGGGGGYSSWTNEAKLALVIHCDFQQQLKKIPIEV